MTPELRAATPDDEVFLRALYRTTRIDEIAPMKWGEAQIDAFCNQQFDAQTVGYRDTYPDAKYQIICGPDAPAGRLITTYIKEGLLILDIALMPEFRNRGWGTALLRSLQDEASRAGVRLFADVEVDTRAPLLYQRLGFITYASDPVRFYMVWSPPGNDPVTTA